MLRIPQLVVATARQACLLGPRSLGQACKAGAGPWQACLAGAHGCRSLSTTAEMRGARKLAQLKKQQADFQCEDGRPVFLKAGLADRVLYSLTLALCAFGLVNVLLVIYDHAKPNSWKGNTC